MYRVMIADDEPMMRMLMRSLLGALEEVEIIAELENGHNIVKLVEMMRPDIVITDIRMPEVDGLEMLRQIHRAALDVEVIILSAYDSFEYAREALKNGAFEYLLKPIDEKLLSDAVRRAEKKLAKRRWEKQDYRQVKRELSKLQSEMTRHVTDKPESAPTSRSIQAALEFIQAHYAENITLSDVAGQVYLNGSYLSNLFKKETGENFNRYLNSLRIAKAKALLCVPSLKISEIAVMVGFRNSSYFIHTFKEVTGLTPQNYRTENHPTMEGEMQG